MSTEICLLTATELVDRIRTKGVSVKEVMEAHLTQIEKINPQLNAIVTLLPDQALGQAVKADKALAKGEDLGLLGGLPIAHKDLNLTKGIRTTFGSPIFQDFIPDQDALIVERLKKAGAITIGKTNTPEFGAGSQTFNEVFGATLNPYDHAKTCGGSSGGAAAALASNMIPIADGSDMGGSLRNPANFCNIVGFRSSPGRVPKWPSKMAWSTLSIHGPMARTVSDIALMMSALAGPDPRCPIAITDPGTLFQQPLGRDFKRTRIAWSKDLGGLPVDPAITDVLESKKNIFESLGCLIEECDPNMANVDEIFTVERAWSYECNFSELMQAHRDKIKSTVIEEIERGMRLSGVELSRMVRQKSELFELMRQFMDAYEFLILPVNQVPPFDVNQPYIDEINGIKLQKYTDWMKTCWAISVTGLPAISVPCGFTPDGLPVGVQIVGRHQDDLGVLQLAYAFEQATQCWKKRP